MVGAKVSVRVLSGYTGTHKVIAKCSGPEYQGLFNVLNARPMDERLVNILNSIYVSLTTQIDNYFNLTSGTFYTFVDDWFTWIYGNLTVMNDTLNQVDATVNYINGNVTQIGATVNQVNNTANCIMGNLTQMNGTLVLMNGTIAHIMGNVTFINGTVSVINGTVNTINTTVNQISGNVSQILTIVNYINGNVTSINVTVKDIQNTTNYIWNEVQNIEAKLDFGGLFYAFVGHWFTYILGNMTQVQNAIGTYLQGNTTLIRNAIANANETILNAIANIGSTSGSSGINITSMQYTLNCSSSGYQFVYQRADQKSFNVKISIANADSFNNTKISGSPERFEIRYYVGNFSTNPVVQSIYIDSPADSGYYEFVCNWIEFDWTVSDGFIAGYSIVIEQSPT